MASFHRCVLELPADWACGTELPTPIARAAGKLDPSDTDDHVFGARRLLGVEKTRTTPYHPHSDGLVERLNRTLLDMLATAVEDQPFEWEQHLQRLCFAYNISPHPTTGFSPFQFMFGREARMPMDIILGKPGPSPGTLPEYVEKLSASLARMYGKV